MLFSACGSGGGGASPEPDSFRAVPLRSLDFAYRRGVLTADSEGVHAEFPSAADANGFKAEIRLMAYRPDGFPAPPQWSFPAVGGRIQIRLDTLTVKADSLYPHPMPGFSMTPRGAGLYRIGTFGGSPLLDTVESLTFGLYDAKTALSFGLYYVDRAAVLNVDTVYCGAKLQAEIRFPEKGFYALSTSSNPQLPKITPMVPGPDPIYYAALPDFFYEETVLALRNCRNPPRDKAPLLGKWKRLASDTATGIRYLEFRPDDSLMQLYQENQGERTLWWTPFFADGSRVFTDIWGNGFAYSLSGDQDTLTMIDRPGIFLRDASPGPLPEWVRPLQAMRWIDGDSGSVDGLAFGGGSLWLNRRTPGSPNGQPNTLVNHAILRYDTSGRLLDSLVHPSAWGSDGGVGAGLASQGDSVLWISSSLYASRVKMETHEDLPPFSPPGYQGDARLVGFDRGKAWFLNSFAMLMGLKPDFSEADTVNAPTHFYWPRLTVSGGLLFQVNNDKIFVRGLRDSRWRATYRIDEPGELLKIAVAGNSVWAEFRKYGPMASGFHIVRLESPAPFTGWLPDPPP